MSSLNIRNTNEQSKGVAQPLPTAGSCPLFLVYSSPRLFTVLRGPKNSAVKAATSAGVTLKCGRE